HWPARALAPPPGRSRWKLKNDEDLEHLAARVKGSFKREFKIFAVQHGYKNQADMLYEAFELLKARACRDAVTSSSADLRSGSEVEPCRATTVWRRRHTCGPDTGARPECECVRRAIRAIDQGRMSRSHDSTGERHFRRAITAFVEHYHLERNHQGLDNRLIDAHG